MEDVFEPNWICTPNAANFAQDALGQNMWDITRLFELWNCSKAKGRLINYNHTGVLAELAHYF
jgi:hypothetical protein